MIASSTRSIVKPQVPFVTESTWESVYKGSYWTQITNHPGPENGAFRLYLNLTGSSIDEAAKMAMEILKVQGAANASFKYLSAGPRREKRQSTKALFYFQSLEDLGATLNSIRESAKRNTKIIAAEEPLEGVKMLDSLIGISNDSRRMNSGELDPFLEKELGRLGIR